MISLDKTSKDQDLGEVNIKLLASPLCLSNCIGQLCSTPTNTDLRLYKQFVFNESGLQVDATLIDAASERQLEFLSGRRAAGLALGELDSHLRRSVLPRHDRSVVWPAGTVGCISHKGELAWAMVAKKQDYRSIGIDLEPLLKSKSIVAVTRHCLNEIEREFATSLDEYSRQIFNTLIFSGKESLFKCLSPLTHQFHSFQSAVFCEMDRLLIPPGEELALEQARFKIQLTEDWSNEFTKGMIFDGHWCLKQGTIFSAVLLVNSR